MAIGLFFKVERKKIYKKEQKQKIIDRTMNHCTKQKQLYKNALENNEKLMCNMLDLRKKQKQNIESSFSINDNNNDML